MGILLFSKNGKEREERIVRLINALPSRHTLEIYHTIVGVSKRFRRPRKNLIIMVFLVGDQADLSDLLQIKELFFDIPLILILPDSEKETVSLGLKMLPRFVSYGDGTFEDVRGVLENMLRKTPLRFGNGKQRWA